jgi:3-hydroxy-9,10-secoandrosta-1,3,5(10)-triene-9,17-dione monooxygenase reductase component
MPVNDDLTTRFRSAVGRFATGVCVITAHAQDGPAGLTLNAFTSLSLDPLLVVVCFDKNSRTLAAARNTGRVAVNVLSSGQADLATAFAGKESHTEKFAGVRWSLQAGVPVLDGVVAWFAGPVRELLPGGDHLIGVIEVEAFGHDAAVDPLLFADGRYATLSPGAD